MFNAVTLFLLLYLITETILFSFDSVLFHIVLFQSVFFREVSELVISIIQARDLAPNQYSGTLDTFIHGVLLPNTDAKFQTKVILKLAYGHK